MQDDTQPQKRLFPDLRATAIALRFLLGAQVIAIILTVARNSALDTAAWHDFLLLTVFTQAVAVCSVLVLKIIAKTLHQLELPVGAAIAFIILLLITIGVFEGMLFGLHQFGMTETRWPADHLTQLVRLTVISAVIIVLALRYTIVSQQAQIQSKTQEQDRLQALQSRIRPHFLFNSMNSVASLIRSDPDMAEKALQDLADVFRVLLADARKMVPITAEGELARQYLDIEKLRLGDRLQVKWTASNVPRSALIPSLTLQPLLENAVYHGIEPSFAGGTVDIQLWSEGEDLKIMISNPVPEVTNPAQHRKGNKIALSNVRERLIRHFGGRATLQNLEQKGSYHVKISMPIVRG